MRRPRLLHLYSESDWARCDHELTYLHPSSGTVRLVAVEQAEGVEVWEDAYEAWLDDVVQPPSAPDVGPYDQSWEDVRAGAVAVPCPPGGCDDGAILLYPAGGWWKGEKSGWTELQRGPRPLRQPGRALRFDDQPTWSPPPGSLSAGRDPWGRVWVLDREGVVTLRDPSSLRVIATVGLPAGIAPVGLGLTDAAAWLLDVHGRLWRQAYGGEWHARPVADRPSEESWIGRELAGGPGDLIVAVVVTPDGPALVTGSGSELMTYDDHGLEHPGRPVVLPDGSFLVAELDGAPPGRVLFTRFGPSVDEHGLPTWAVEETLVGRSFDGRAVVLDHEGVPWITTAGGLRRLRSSRVPLVTRGRLETFALDAQQPGVTWHRVFLDVCLPPGTALRVQAKSAEELLPVGLRRGVRSERGLDTAPTGDLPLGSQTPEDEDGWITVGALDTRAGWADQTFPPGGAERPSQEPRLIGPPGTNPDALSTLEAALDVPAGRYLWLRIHFVGTSGRTPALTAVRVTWPRPSLLSFLPSFWRADPGSAQRTDRFLALFEGMYHELDARIDALPLLFDPRVCPPEALEWLGSLLALSFDQRIGEAVRRQLLLEMGTLYQRRGTLGAIRRLVEILTGSRVEVIEAFRLRQRTGSKLGETEEAALGRLGSVLGNGLQLGGGDSLDVEVEQTGSLSDQSLRAWYGATAHRFQVLIFGCSSPELVEIVEAAIEAAKPAHTLHELCWVTGGFRLGVSSWIGLGTLLSTTPDFRPAVLDQAVVGANLLGTPRTRFGTRLGASRIGHRTLTG
jgi:phage tail-like protein